MDLRGRVKSVLSLAGREPAAAADTRPVFAALSELVARHARGADVPSGSADLTPFEYRVFSQNGEDGVIAELLRRVGVAERFFVEFGAGAGSEGNCVFLADVLGWSGLFIESDAGFFCGLQRKYASNDRIVTVHSAVTPENVEALFTHAGVPPEPDIVSIDIDGNDYWVWSALRTSRPRVIVVEYNATLGTGRRLVQRPEGGAAEYDGSDAFGASLDALRTLGREKGYRLVHTDLCGVNAFFVRDELTGEFPAEGSVPARACNFGLAGKHPMVSSIKDQVLLDLDARPPGGLGRSS